MATLSTPRIIDFGVAASVLPGQSESGDRHLVHHRPGGVLIAAIDGIGHGDEAGSAAQAAVDLLQNASPEDSVVALVRQCHEALRSTRGVVMSIASLDFAESLMTWVGVGNVQGILLRRNPKSAAQEELLLRAGVLGAQLPSLHAAALPIFRGDTLIFATDGIRNGFADKLSPRESPQKSASRILDEFTRGNDDALVLVTRYLENQK
jgi:hypothetical protein